MKLRITYNAPVILTFALAAVVVQLLGESAKPYVAAWPTFGDWRAYLGLFTHPLGHANWEHLLGNFSLILLLGPLLEERHGSRSLLGMFVVTALVTGLVNTAFTDTFLVGASGIVFMLILLASTANIRQGEIPLTFLAVALLYLGREVLAAFRADNISQLAHLVGGTVGAIFGFLTAPRGAKASPRPVTVAKLKSSG
ncbi:MAG: rhomboid family intramembrane serine protease [Kofleriaceae bacterium]